MWPVHTWLPDAHVEAPTAGSVLLAAILLKMAGYGFIRFSVGLFPIASEYFIPLIYFLSLVAIIYTSFVALNARGYEKINCIFICCSHGICNTWNIYFYSTGDRRKYISND